MKPGWVLTLILLAAFTLSERSVRADDAGTVVVLNEAPVPLQFSVPMGVPCKVTYPGDKVRLWKTDQGSFSGADIPSGTVFTSGQGVFGDADGNGIVNLVDLIAVRNALDTYPIDGPDVFPSGYVDANDLTAVRNALGSGGDMLTVFVQGLTVSTTLGDVSIQLLTDPDEDSVFTAAATSAVTVMDIQVSPNYGFLGSLVTVQISPAIAPLAFDEDTTAEWAGDFYWSPPPFTPERATSQHVLTTFSPSQLHPLGTSQAMFILGDGTKVSGEIGDTSLIGFIDGQATLIFGSIRVSKSFTIYVDTPYGFVTGGGGVGEPANGLYALDPYDPAAIGTIPLEHCVDQYVATVLADKNALSEAIAPPMLPANIVSFDGEGHEIDRVTVWMYLAGRDDFGPDWLVYYSNWEKPIVLVTQPVDPGLHPTLTIIRVDPNGSWDFRIR